jgi:hypothetical protein
MHYQVEKKSPPPVIRTNTVIVYPRRTEHELQIIQEDPELTNSVELVTEFEHNWTDDIFSSPYVISSLTCTPQEPENNHNSTITRSDFIDLSASPFVLPPQTQAQVTQKDCKLRDNLIDLGISSSPCVLPTQTQARGTQLTLISSSPFILPTQTQTQGFGGIPASPFLLPGTPQLVCPPGIVRSVVKWKQ